MSVSELSQNQNNIRKCIICAYDQNKPGINGINVLCKCEKCGMIYTNITWKEEIIKTDIQDWWQESYHFDQERMLEATSQIKLVKHYKSNGTLLDYGCGGGSFLKIAKEAGFESYGIEIDSRVAEIVSKNLGIEIKSCTIETIPFENLKFDIITLWNVLEHCPEPDLVIKKMYNLLQDDGIIIIEVPNEDSINRKMAKLAKYFGMNQFLDQIYVKTAHIAGHVNHFTFKTLNLLVSNNNFDIIEANSKNSPVNLITDTFNKNYKIPKMIMILILNTIDLIGKATNSRSRIVLVCKKITN